MMGLSSFAVGGLFKTELLTRLRFFLEESETGTRAQARGLPLHLGPHRKDWPGGAQMRRAMRTCLSAASVGTPGQIEAQMMGERQPAPAVSDPQLLPPKERQGERLT